MPNSWLRFALESFIPLTNPNKSYVKFALKLNRVKSSNSSSVLRATSYGAKAPRSIISVPFNRKYACLKCAKSCAKRSAVSPVAARHLREVVRFFTKKFIF